MADLSLFLLLATLTNTIFAIVNMILALALSLYLVRVTDKMSDILDQISRQMFYTSVTRKE